jgi:short-subunit dehydrogenase
MVKQKSGTIVNVGSVLSHRVVPNNTVYCAAKYGILGFSRALMLEAKPHNVRVLAFLPGGMATSWYDERPDIDTSWMMQAESVAQVLVHMLAAPKDSVPYEVIIAPNTGTSWP